MDTFRLLARQAPSVDESNDENIGSAQDDTKNSNSASTLVSTLVPVLLVALLFFAIFLILRRIFPRKYSPRSFVGSLRESRRSPNLPSGLFNWIGSFFSIPDSYVLNHHSLDAYLFLRLFKISIVCLLVGIAITWPVLFPVNATGGNGMKQFDMLTFGNVANPWRFWAHAGCAWLYFGFIMFMITRESIFYINLRQAYLMSPMYASRMSSRTVLFSSVPDAYLDERKLREILGEHVRRVWIPTDVSNLEDLVQERDKAAMKLEGAETKLLKLANKARLKSVKKNGGRNEEEQTGITSDGAESGSIAARWLTPKQRPTHRLKPLIGKKVDTIEWSRAELARLIPLVEEEQAKHRALHADTKRINSVFVEYDSLPEAQAAYQSLTHHQALHMSPRFSGFNPHEIIWKNLRIKWWERVVRGFATTGLVTATIIFWSIPVAFVASISNINYLIEVLPFLEFINKLPTVLLGLVTGLLPTILLAVLMALLPIFLRAMARLGGDPTLSQVELTVQKSYFAFQVVQVFLVATLGSAASSAVGIIIDNPGSITSMLSKQIPKASNFYLAYFVLQGLGVAAGLLLGIVGLILFYLLGKLFDSTPRKMYRRWSQLASLGWGTVFPIYTNLFVIAICYACIAPLVLGFAAIGLWLFYFAYRYNILFVYDVSIDTKGLVYPQALQQLFVGLYIAEICLVGLLGVNLSNVGAIGPFALVILLLIFTALYHLSLNAALGPLLSYLPKSLEPEERRLLAETEESAIENNGAGSHEPKPAVSTIKHLPPAPHKKPSMIQKFLRPDIYTDYATMRRLIPAEFSGVDYEPEVARDAFFHPAITSQVPLLWIPKDPMGISTQEIRETGKVIPITDEGAHLDEKNKIIWDVENSRPPIYEKPIDY